MLWGFVNALHAQVQRLDRGVDKIAPEMKDLGQEQDGSEIKSRELELLTDRVQNLGDRRDAFEAMRDLAAEGYRAETGDTWRPRNGSHSSQTGKLTSAAIDARDYLRARKDRETSGAPAPGNPGRHHRRQARQPTSRRRHRARWTASRSKYDDIILLPRRRPRRRRSIAAQAGPKSNRVHQVVCKLDWNRN